MKKKLAFVVMTLALFVFGSCTTLQLPAPPPPFAFAGIFDYSPLTSKGVFVTESNSVSFNYETIGSIYAESRGGWINKTYVEPSLDALYNEVLRQLGAYNANGIVNLRLNVSGSIGGQNKKYYLEGMAIRKTDAGKIDDRLTTAKRVVGEIDGIALQIMEAYANGTLVVTSEKLSAERLKKAWKRFFYKQSQIKFFTPDGYAQKKAYAGFIDNQIVNYETNEFISLE